MITIKQYQEFCKIPSGSTIMEYNKRIGSLIGLDMNKLSNEEVNIKVKEWMTKIFVSKKELKHIKLDGKWFYIDTDLYELAFSQWIYFDDTMRGKDDKNTYEIMHFLISTFLRECRIHKSFPKEFNVNEIERTAKLVQEHMKIEDGLNLINFFFAYTLASMKNTQIEYLERLEKAVWEDKTND